MQSHRKSSGREAQDGRDLTRYPESDQQDPHDAHQLHPEPQDGAQRLHPPPVKRMTLQELNSYRFTEDDAN